MDEIENNILDGQNFNETVQNNKLKAIFLKKINAKKQDENKNEIKNLSDELFKKAYNLSSSSVTGNYQHR